MENTNLQDNCVGTIVFRHSSDFEEKMDYTDESELLKSYAEALDARGPNGVYLENLQSVDLKYKVYEMTAGEFGFDVEPRSQYNLALELGGLQSDKYKSIAENINNLGKLENALDLRPEERVTKEYDIGEFYVSDRLSNVSTDALRSALKSQAQFVQAKSTELQNHMAIEP